MKRGRRFPAVLAAKPFPALPSAMALRFFLSVLAVLSLLLAACDMPWRVAGGSGTETSNGEIVAGRVLMGDGKPASGASVYVRPAAYLKDTVGIDSLPPPADAVTDREGHFRLKLLETGSYKAEVRDGKGSAVFIGFELKSLSKTLELVPETLRPVGTLQGKAEPAPGMTGPMYVQVYGMERLVRTDDTGFFVIPDLPAGPIKFRVLSSSPGTSYASPILAVITPEATVVSETLRPITFANEDYALWPFSRRIYVNTITAGVADTVTDFPLLVRLDANRFDFDLSDGKDVRFADADGSHLPYQLDSWDQANRQAAFWVRLDTVFGNSRQQYITLHFGRRDAPDFSAGKAVFSTFGGVWHFSESVDALGEGFFADASPFSATAAAKVIAKDRLGAIGLGSAFRGTAHSVVANGTAAMKPARSLTLSAWVYITGTGIYGAEFASMGDNYGLRSTPKGDGHFFLFSDTSVKDPVWKDGNQFPATQSKNLDLRGNWHHITGRFDGAAIKVFVDGVEEASFAHAQDIVYPFGKEFRMGMHGNGAKGYDFTGSLDEVQVSPVVRTPGWIKLGYQSQKPGSTVLEFR